MKKNIIANGMNLILSMAFMAIVFFMRLNALSLITSFIVTVTNMLLAIYSMSINEHPVIKIGRISGSVYFFNIATFLMQILLIVGSLVSSLWVTILCMFGVLVYVECLSLFMKNLFRAMRFHITVTLSVSFLTLLLYCVLRVYREYGYRLPSIWIAVAFLAIYIFLIYKEKNFLKMTAYSALFSASVVMLALGNYASQNIYSAILYLVSFTPAMFLLLLAGHSIDAIYQKTGVSEVSSVLMHFPVAGSSYFIGLMAILGFPPFSLFFGRLVILQSAVTAGNYVTTVLLTIVFVVSSYFLLKNALPTLFGSKMDALLTVKEPKFNSVFLLVLVFLILVLTLLIPGFIEALISDARAYIMGVL